MRIFMVLSIILYSLAYDRPLFEAAVQALTPFIHSLDGAQRKQLLDSYKKVGHQTDQDFLTRLSRQEKNARYEAAYTHP